MLPCFHGFYGSVWDEPDFYGEAEHFGLPENFPFWEYVDWGAYKNALSRKFCDVVEENMSEFIERIEFQSLHSPKYYNFENDSIYCIIRPKKKAIAEYIYTHKEAFEVYLKAHLKSRDGFISYHSYHFEDWEAKTNKFTKLDDKGLTLGFILDFIVEETERDIDSEDHIYQKFHYVDCSINEFYTKEFGEFVETLGGISEFVTEDAKQAVMDGNEDMSSMKAEVDAVKEFIHSNYNTDNLLNLIHNTFSNEFLNLDAIHNHVMYETTKNVLKLKL